MALESTDEIKKAQEYRKRSRETQNLFDETKIGDSKSVSPSTQKIAAAIAGAGGGTGTVTDTASNVALMSGNAPAMAVGAGLKVLSAKEGRERQYRESLYQNEMQKIANQQSALQNLIQLSRGLKL